MARKDIIQELNELGSSLAGTPFQNVYSVPNGYFEAFASSVFSRLNAENQTSFLTEIPKSNPYTVPAGYFDGFAESLLHAVRHRPDHLNAQEELESLSPLLSSLKKEPVFSVPQDYFENFTVETNHRQPAKVVAMFSRKMMRYAASFAAVMVVAIAMLLYFNRRTGVDKIMANVEKDVKKIDDVQQLDNLAEFLDAGLNEKEVASNTVPKDKEVENLLKDVPLDELQEFSEESKDIQDVMMTN
jgi:hypothetical protein